MKKYLLFSILLGLFLAPFAAQAQGTIVYDFEDGAMPEGFTLINNDMLIPALEADSIFAQLAWAVESSSAFEGFAALSISWYENEQGDEVGPADDWMILPKITLGEGAMLTFLARSATSSGNFLDDYQVLINSGEPTIESFEENGGILSQEQGVLHDAFQEYAIDLSEYANQAVHIAFRNVTNTNGYGLWIDDITITEAAISSSLTVDNEAFAMKLFPNPAGTESPTLQYTLATGSEVTVSLQDMTGRTVQVQRLGQQPSGEHQLSLATQALPAGAYIVSLRTADTVSTARLVVR